MQPKLELLSGELTSRILDEAHQLMMNPGVKVLSEPARLLLAEAGAQIEASSDVVKIPEKVARAAVSTVPKTFLLYNRLGECKVTYGGDKVQFDPGSCAVHIMDPQTLEHRPAKSCDLIRLVKVAEMLPQYDAQSTAVVCDDVPKEIGDLYRLYLVLMHSLKPIVTGAFSSSTLEAMIDLVALVAGGRAQGRSLSFWCAALRAAKLPCAGIKRIANSIRRAPVHAIVERICRLLIRSRVADAPIICPARVAVKDVRGRRLPR